VEVITEGVSPAVKDFNGMVVVNMSEIEVEALPQDMPERIKIDVSGLLKIGDALHVKDIKVGEGVQILTNPEDIVIVITAAGEEEAAPVAEEGAVAAEPEVIEKGKKEEEVEE
jgi:large subunit ribosomal protein L25